jgi:hypothetical protein
MKDDYCYKYILAWRIDGWGQEGVYGEKVQGGAVFRLKMYEYKERNQKML